MYKDLLNLHKLPFENVPDPDFFYDSGDFSRIFANLTDSLQAGRGLMVVTGAIGSGKTTLSRLLYQQFIDDGFVNYSFLGISGTEQCHLGDTQGSSHVHQAGIIAQKQ